MRTCFDHIKPRGGCRSGFEYEIKRSLEDLNIQAWHEHTTLPYKTRHGIDREYLPDFTLYRKDGGLMFLEVKGWMNQAAADKMTAVRWSFSPALDIRILWQSKSSKVGLHQMVPAEWCEWRDYPFAIKSIPEEWVAELMTKEEFKASGLPTPPKWVANRWHEDAVA